MQKHGKQKLSTHRRASASCSAGAPPCTRHTYPWEHILDCIRHEQSGPADTSCLQRRRLQQRAFADAAWSWCAWFRPVQALQHVQRLEHSEENKAQHSTRRGRQLARGLFVLNATRRQCSATRPEKNMAAHKVSVSPSLAHPTIASQSNTTVKKKLNKLVRSARARAARATLARLAERKHGSIFSRLCVPEQCKLTYPSCGSEQCRRVRV